MRTVINPVVWSYFEFGVGLEAHQQNTVAQLDEVGWPKEGFYRDNGGYCFPESRYDLVDSWIPGLEKRVETACSDGIIDRCLRDYLFVNNAVGVINALSVGRTADETTLLKVFREEIASLVEIEPATSSLLSVLLDSDQIPCKGNLFTRFEGYDELDSTLDDESVYVEIENPLATLFRPA
nr:IucA/IucC family C-terminal-domain containing protein [Halovenus rubra]